MLRKFIELIFIFFRRLFGVRVESRKTGFSRLTKEDLESMGVDINVYDNEFYAVGGPISEKAMSVWTENFEPNRLILNLAFATGEDPNELVEEFDQPVQVLIWYKESDQGFADEKKKPVAMAFWNGKSWVRFEDMYEFRLVEDDRKGYVGYAEIILTRWDDPMIAWGR